MPVGFGIHPYFVRDLACENERVLLKTPLAGVYPGETQIPTGTYVPLPEPLNFEAEKELTADFLDKCFCL